MENKIETKKENITLTSTKNVLLRSFALLIGTIVWGFAFVAQSEGGAVTGDFTFSSIRMLIAGATVLVVVMITRWKKPRNIKALLKGGVICGVFLAIATNLQQFGLSLGTSVGKAGFITAMYIILVPVLAFILFRKKSSWNVWAGVAIAIVSLYLLCIKEGFDFQLSDLLVLGCALMFSFQILSIDKFVKDVNPLELCVVEFFVCGLISAVPMFIFEIGKDPAAWAVSMSSMKAWIPLLYAAVMSGGVGYTLQAVGQKGVNPTLAALIMSLESVFAVLAGWLILHQTLSTREFIGCALMFVAIIIAQIPIKTKKTVVPQIPDDEPPS